MITTKEERAHQKLGAITSLKKGILKKIKFGKINLFYWYIFITENKTK